MSVEFCDTHVSIRRDGITQLWNTANNSMQGCFILVGSFRKNVNLLSLILQAGGHYISNKSETQVSMFAHILMKVLIR